MRTKTHQVITLPVIDNQEDHENNEPLEKENGIKFGQIVKTICEHIPKLYVKKDKRISDVAVFQPQHIYFLSDEKPRNKGDVYYHHKWNQVFTLCYPNNTAFELDLSNKVIASTDKELTPNSWIGERFVAAYVKAYNEGDPINHVNLEYETIHKGEVIDESYPDSFSKPKTRPDGSVITHQANKISKSDYPYRVGRKQGGAILNAEGLEVVLFPVGKEQDAQEYCDFLNGQTYSRSEVERLIVKSMQYGHDENTLGKYLHQINTRNFIEEHLKPKVHANQNEIEKEK